LLLHKYITAENTDLFEKNLFIFAHVGLNGSFVWPYSVVLIASNIISANVCQTMILCDYD